MESTMGQDRTSDLSEKTESQEHVMRISRKELHLVAYIDTDADSKMLGYDGQYFDFVAYRSENSYRIEHVGSHSRKVDDTLLAIRRIMSSYTR